jgi:serine protease Do
VSTPNDVRKAMADARKDGKKTVLMRVKSGEATRFVAVPAGRA